MMPALRGVIFDMDGVLCDSEALTAEAGCRMFAETYGVEIGPHEFEPFVGMGDDRYLGGVAERHGIRLTLPRDKIRMYEIYGEIAQGKLAPLPGVVDFIADCRRRGLKLAVASSADAMKVETNLREIGLPGSCFDAVVTGDDVVQKKPHPEIFLKAAARLGLEPVGCLVVEDAPSGVKAAKAAGCWCLALTSSFGSDELREAGADWVARDLAGAGWVFDGIKTI
ncbi:MAG: HAD-IA family hydrolase [Verrucomicrobiae bacterium]|nr:HAD-IA family hydrolase [Verrucomicrobiae bacterium]